MTSVPKTRRARRPGFALVVTLSLMILLTIIAVGLLSLSAISLRGSSQGMAQAEARANARMALALAIGELQRLAGPDQRVTAPASILDENPDTEAAEGVARPHLTGVWRSRGRDGEQAPDYDGQKEQDFLGWLVSDPLTSRSPDQRSYARQAVQGDSAVLIGSGTSADPGDKVQAGLLGLGKAGAKSSALAWAVFDEGMKARVSLPEPDRAGFDFADLLAEQAAAAVPGFASVRDSQRDWKPLALLGNERLKLVSLAQTQLTLPGGNSADFHHLTADSLGLPVNVVDGGFAADLSLLFDQSTLPGDYDKRFLYSDESQPLAEAPSRDAGMHPMPTPDPSWRLLHSYARLHDRVDDPRGSPTLAARVTPRPPAGTQAQATLFHPHFTEQQISPVIAKAQFIFSYGFGHRSNAKSPYIIWMIIDPVITLWNPYDVNLTFKQGRIDLYRVPMAFSTYLNGQLLNPSEPTLFANTFWDTEFTDRKNRYYRLNLKPAIGSDSEITMRPGEHLVFTAHNTVYHYEGEYYKKGLDLRPGWNPPAGNASNPYVGGVATLHVCVGMDGKATANINGKMDRMVVVKPGDVIQFAVKPARGGIDTLDELGNKEVSAYLKFYMESVEDGDFSGAIEVDLGAKEFGELPSFGPPELPALIVPGNLPTGSTVQGQQAPAMQNKEPFLIASLHLKSGLDSRHPARSWLQNAPTNQFASMGLDQPEDSRFHQYEFAWEPMTDWNSSPTVELDRANRGYGASGIYSQSGVTNAPFVSVPLTPLMSMAQLQHAPINSGGQLPLQTRPIGNSFAHPLLPPTKAIELAGHRTFLDHSFLANNALFDRYFFSSASSQRASVAGRSRNLKELLDDFFTNELPLPNLRMRPLLQGVSDPAKLASELAVPGSGFQQIGAHLGIAGAFNVNSTSVPAWKAMLASLQEAQTPNMNPESGQLGDTGGDGLLVSRNLPPTGRPFNKSGDDPLRALTDTWAGHRRLDESQIDELARQLVSQIKRRGPFQSLAEFVNRRLSSGELGVSGALQSAIDASGINGDITAAGVPLGPDPDAANPDAAAGSTFDGAPAAISQGDLLTPLAPVLSARSDTFKIRAYGQASYGDGTVKAWCEAVVQRSPDYLDPSDDPASTADELNPNGPNAVFGRRFHVVSFRWLSSKEVL